MPRGVPVASLIDRFLRKVNKQGKIVSEELGNCWEWLGGKYGTGYGQLIKDIWGEELTHRWSYRYFKKEDIPDKKLVRHKCDNRSCVNPDHLELGDSKENVKDMLERNKNNPCGRKFNKEQKEQIVKLRDEGKTYQEIATLYNCNRRTIERLCLNKTYTVI
jgi:hypothetical protein